jgi:hypothetical protein
MKASSSSYQTSKIQLNYYYYFFVWFCSAQPVPVRKERTLHFDGLANFKFSIASLLDRPSYPHPLKLFKNHPTLIDLRQKY